MRKTQRILCLENISGQLGETKQFLMHILKDYIIDSVNSPAEVGATLSVQRYKALIINRPYVEYTKICQYLRTLESSQRRLPIMPMIHLAHSKQKDKTNYSFHLYLAAGLPRSENQLVSMNTLLLDAFRIARNKNDYYLLNMNWAFERNRPAPAIGESFIQKT